MPRSYWVRSWPPKLSLEQRDNSAAQPFDPRFRMTKGFALDNHRAAGCAAETDPPSRNHTGLRPHPPYFQEAGRRRWICESTEAGGVNAQESLGRVLDTLVSEDDDVCRPRL